MSIYKKLMAARMALQGQEIKKGGENTFAKYKYLELGDFLPATQTICAELGLCGTVSFTADLASLTLTDIDDSTQQIVFTSPMGSAALKGCHEVQNVGAVETYQRRYLWVTAMEIVEHDALDSGPPVEKTEKPRLAQVGEPGFIGGAKASALAASGPLPDMNAIDHLAENIKANFSKIGPKRSAEFIAQEELDDVQLIYLSTKLPSNLNSAIKKAQEELRKEAANV